MIPKKYRKTLEVYKIFADKDLDFSESAAQEIFDFETHGKGNISVTVHDNIGKKLNGYFVGKRFMDITVAMWFEDIPKRGWHTLIQELYNDSTFPHWWLDKIFKKLLKDKEKFYKEHGIYFKPIVK